MKIVELFEDGQNRSVKLPKELFPDEDKVYINKVGNIAVLISYHDPWKSLFDNPDKPTPTRTCLVREIPSPKLQT